MDTLPPDRDLAAIGLLQEPVRRALYGHVVAAGGEVSRNQAAEAVGVQRGLAAFHLDKLVEAGLLEASFRRLGDRRGPGAGRPAKLYRRAAGEVAASLPPRTYETAAHLLAEAAEQAGADLELQATARRAGQDAGRRWLEAGPAPQLEQVLAARGYEPYRDGAVLRLRNCPFANLAREFPVLVCAMNLALVEGLLEGMGLPPGSGAMDPVPGRCCVAVHAARLRLRHPPPGRDAPAARVVPADGRRLPGPVVAAGRDHPDRRPGGRAAGAAARRGPSVDAFTFRVPFPEPAEAGQSG